mmetsp:Transcript_2615/g.5848  ORF Transcript_2615/g.5848 Transcript_2615/m.5848 type:complete len:176 (-) Transcript_2615:1184-1711(-)
MLSLRLPGIKYCCFQFRLLTTNHNARGFQSTGIFTFSMACDHLSLYVRLCFQINLSRIKSFSSKICDGCVCIWLAFPLRCNLTPSPTQNISYMCRCLAMDVPDPESSSSPAVLEKLSRASPPPKQSKSLSFASAPTPCPSSNGNINSNYGPIFPRRISPSSPRTRRTTSIPADAS